eukprot:6512883-Karenia_brevis.AAC.1
MSVIMMMMMMMMMMFVTGPLVAPTACQMRGWHGPSFGVAALDLAARSGSPCTCPREAPLQHRL